MQRRAPESRASLIASSSSRCVFTGFERKKEHSIRKRSAARANPASASVKPVSDV
jgi:hypothetical protein